MPGSPTRHQGEDLAGRELDALTGSTTPRQEEGNQAAGTTDGRSIAEESPEPRNNRKEAPKTEEPTKGGHQGFGDIGEKALGERGMLDGAAKAKRTEGTTSTLEEKTPTLWDQNRKRPSSPTHYQETAAKRLPKGSGQAEPPRRTTWQKAAGRRPSLRSHQREAAKIEEPQLKAAKGKQPGQKNCQRQIHRRGIVRAKKQPERSHQD